jgi:CRP-like cAMP-binding protein
MGYQFFGKIGWRHMETSFVSLISSPWQRLAFFDGLGQSVVSELLEGSKIVNTKSRQILYAQGEAAEHFGFVTAGLFRLTRINGSEQRTVLDFVGAGGFVGILLMNKAGSRYPVNVQSIGPGQFLQIPRATYEKYWLKSPEIVRRTQISTMERMEFFQWIREIQRFSLERKVASLLLRLSNPENAELRLSRTDIADALGSSVEAVIRILSAWEKSGLVTVDQNGQEFLQIDRLRQLEQT